MHNDFGKQLQLKQREKIGQNYIQIGSILLYNIFDPVMGHSFPTIICDKPVILDSNTNQILFKFNIPIPIRLVN